MSISLVVAVTDSDWFEMLRHRTDLAEVNFWAPVLRAARSGDLCSEEVSGEAGLGIIELAQRAVFQRLTVNPDGC